MSAYVVEMEAHDGTGVVTLRYGSQTIVSGPGDPVPNVTYEARILDAGQIQRTVFGGEGRIGAAEASYGFVELNNGDGKLGHLKDYAFDGRSIRIWRVVPGQALVGARLLFSGLMKGIRTSNAWESLEVLVKDRQAELGEPLLTATYAGTTVATDMTIEGNEDLKGQVKAGAWGAPRQIPLRLVNVAHYLWQACANPVVSIALYDGANLLPFAGDYPTVETLVAATIPKGAFATCCRLGLVRPANMMAIAYTADIIEHADRSAARVAERMLRHFGLADADFDLASFAALALAHPDEVEFFAAGEVAALAAVQTVLNSVFATILTRLDGRFSVVSLAEPDPALAVATFTLRDIDADGAEIEFNVAENADGAIVPPHQVLLDYGRLHTTFRKTDLAGIVQDDPEKVAFFAAETRRETADRPVVKARHLLAKPITVATQLVRQADAARQAQRFADLLCRQRDRATLPLMGPRTAAVDIGDVVIVRAPLFGWGAGKALRVLGIGDDFDEQTRTFTLWG